MPEDFENLTKYKMGFAKKIVLRPGCLPSKFDCQVTNQDLPCKILINDDSLIPIETSELEPVIGK